MPGIKRGSAHFSEVELDDIQLQLAQFECELKRGMLAAELAEKIGMQRFGMSYRKSADRGLQCLSSFINGFESAVVKHNGGPVPITSPALDALEPDPAQELNAEEQSVGSQNTGQLNTYPEAQKLYFWRGVGIAALIFLVFCGSWALTNRRTSQSPLIDSVQRSLSERGTWRSENEGTRSSIFSVSGVRSSSGE